MGGGIWSMHFVAMLAFVMPDMEVDYDLGLTLCPAAADTRHRHRLHRRQPLRHRTPELALSGLFMGLGIVAMHYTGMAAMRMALISATRACGLRSRS